MARRFYITDKTHPKHVLVMALQKKGYKNFELLWSPKFSPDYGWNVMEGHNNIPNWLGYNKKHALREIHKLPASGG